MILVLVLEYLATIAPYSLEIILENRRKNQLLVAYTLVERHTTQENDMRSEDAKQQLLTKRMYDELVKRFPVFMSTTWVNLWKQWSIDCVRVYQCAGSGLATLLNKLDMEEEDF